MSSNPSVVRATGLSFSYGETTVFDQLSFSISNRLVSLQGPSGTGKTTLLKLICRALDPDSGEIERSFSSSILVLQEDALLPWLTGDANLSLSRSFDRDRLADSAIADELCGYSGRLAQQMSFGQRRYLELVRALGSDADILVFDEPLNFLDQERRNRILAEMMFQAKTRPVLSTTHYIEDFDGAPIHRLLLSGDMPHSELEVIGG